MLKVSVAPRQPASTGVTATVAISGRLAAKKSIFPLPVAGRPILGLLFVQSNTAPGVPLQTTCTDSPPQVARSDTGFTDGRGRMITVKMRADPVHPPKTGVTVIRAVSTVSGASAVKDRSPLPTADNPIFGLLFVQVNAAPCVPLKATCINEPSQASSGVGWLTLGGWVIRILKSTVSPTQAPITGDTRISAESPAAKKRRLPLPAAAKPMAVSEFIHCRPAPGLALNATNAESPAQKVWSPGGSTTGKGAIISRKVSGAPAQTPNWGDTTTKPVSGVATCIARKIRLSVPDEPKPRVVSELTQFQTADCGMPVRKIRALSPEQTTWSGMALTGRGWTVRVNTRAAPVQFPSTGVTVMVAVCTAAGLPAGKTIFPFPTAGRPMAGLLLIQLKSAPGVPPKLTFTGAPPHT